MKVYAYTLQIVVSVVILDVSNLLSGYRLKRDKTTNWRRNAGKPIRSKLWMSSQSYDLPAVEIGRAERVIWGMSFYTYIE